VSFTLLGSRFSARARVRTIAFAASALVVISAAYVPDVSGALQAAFPGHYRMAVGGLALAAIVIATILVAIRIRTDRARRLGLLAVGLGGAAGYFAAFRTGNVDVDVVEAFHFVEYGALAMLLYRASWQFGDARRIGLPLLGGLAVGIFDESLQSFLASRVGEAHDVLMDLAAVACGLFVAVAVDPPRMSALRLSRPALAHLTAVAVAVLILFSAFFNAVHLGYEIEDPEIGVFRSRYSADNLRLLAAEREHRWSDGLPPRSRFAREDHYLTEALWHVRERNDAVAVGDALTAWRENRILEKFYAPLLEIAAVNAEYRWSPDQRALTADAAARAYSSVYVSRAEALPIYVPPIRKGGRRSFK
jgi:VanZ family protein